MTTLSDRQAALLGAARTAVLATVSEDGRPRTVPICFVTMADPGDGLVVYSPIDEKPKSHAAPLALARVRDIRRNDAVSVLIDRWDEDWSQLGWLRLDGRAEVVETTPGDVVTALRAKYPQYADHRLETRPAIRIVVERVRAWGTLGDG